MKRSEMLRHVSDEVESILNFHKFKSPAYNEKDFCNTCAGDILDMLEGFGMLPPGYTYKKLPEENKYPEGLIVNKWEQE